MDGASATAKIHAAAPEIGVLVLTTYDSDSDILRAVEAGAIGYLLKTPRATSSSTAFALQRAANRCSRPDVATRLMGRLRAPPGQADAALSQRELEVLGFERRDSGRGQPAEAFIRGT
jgi:DNA-binding NarL/FixJ family response regulator